MTAFVALLRAINVGGTGVIKMADLKTICEGLGFRNVKTLLQSGNVVFESRGSDKGVAKKLADAIEASHGFRPTVVVRSADEIADAMKRNPFKPEEKSNPTFVVVVFMPDPPTSGAEERVAAIKVDGERLHLSGRELHAYYPNGQGKSKVTKAVLERALGVPATARNWNTVTKLRELARSAG